MRRHHLFRGVLTFFIIFLLPEPSQAFNHTPAAPSAINRHSAASPVFNYPYAVPRIKADLPPGIPTGAKVLYHGERRYERYGLVEHAFTVYELDGKTWLRREQWFSGSEETVSDKEGIARNACEVTMPLSAKQVKTLRKALKKARFAQLAKSFTAEEQQYQQFLAEIEKERSTAKKVVNEKGDTVYVLPEKPRDPLRFYQASRWSHDIDWAGTVEGLHTDCRFYVEPSPSDTWSAGHPCRDRYVDALDRFNQQLDRLVYDYKMQHPFEGEIRSFMFSTSGGMMMHIGPGGRMLRQGSRVEIYENDGQWLVCGYVNEQEDTMKVGREVIAHVEELFGRYDQKALHPVFAEGEEVIKSEVDDGIQWNLQVSCHTRESIMESGTFGETYHKPERAGMAYDAQVELFRTIREYLLGFLSLKDTMQRALR